MKIIFWHALLALTTLSFHTHMIRLSFVPCELPLRELDGTLADRVINESGNTAEETHTRSQMSSSKSPPANEEPTSPTLFSHCINTLSVLSLHSISLSKVHSNQKKNALDNTIMRYLTSCPYDWSNKLQLQATAT